MSHNNRILIVDDEEGVRRLLYEVARKAGYEVHLAENGQEAIEKTRLVHPAVILMDIKMPVMDGMEAFEVIHGENGRIAVILMTAKGTVDTAVEAMRRGAFDYLVKPSTVPELRILIERAFEMQRLSEEVIALRTEVQEQHRATNIIGNSSIMQQVYKDVGRVAQTNATVLISGESGSGKELIAKTIHSNSLRNQGPFIKMNCGALPEGLMESEMFGYEKGAFTGAVARKLGRFELAHDGTLFFDEIGELPPALQVKLLRVVQEREFERVGGTETIQVNVRFIAATNRNLSDLVKRCLFREDLYYRLNVVPIHVPPLRDRKEDIPLFIDQLVRRFAVESHRNIPYVTPEAVKILTHYSWPGNVRELANVLERAVIMSSGVISLDALPGLTLESGAGKFLTPEIPQSGTLKEILRQVEKEVITKTLREYCGNRVKTSQALNISRRALLYKIEEYGLEKIHFDNKRLVDEGE